MLPSGRFEKKYFLLIKELLKVTFKFVRVPRYHNFRKSSYNRYKDMNLSDLNRGKMEARVKIRTNYAFLSEYWY